MNALKRRRTTARTALKDGGVKPSLSFSGGPPQGPPQTGVPHRQTYRTFGVTPFLRWHSKETDLSLDGTTSFGGTPSLEKHSIWKLLSHGFLTTFNVLIPDPELGIKDGGVYSLHIYNVNTKTYWKYNKKRMRSNI